VVTNGWMGGYGLFECVSMDGVACVRVDARRVASRAFVQPAQRGGSAGDPTFNQSNQSTNERALLLLLLRERRMDLEDD